MKGFKDKSGKFRPTGNKTKSSLKKSDVRKKETFTRNKELHGALGYHWGSDEQKENADIVWDRMSESQKRDMIEKSFLETSSTDVEFFKKFHEGKGIRHVNSYSDDSVPDTMLDAEFYEKYLDRFSKGESSLPPRVFNDLLVKLNNEG